MWRIRVAAGVVCRLACHLEYTLQRALRLPSCRPRRPLLGWGEMAASALPSLFRNKRNRHPIKESLDAYGEARRGRQARRGEARLPQSSCCLHSGSHLFPCFKSAAPAARVLTPVCPATDARGRLPTPVDGRGGAMDRGPVPPSEDRSLVLEV